MWLNETNLATLKFHHILVLNNLLRTEKQKCNGHNISVQCLGQIWGRREDSDTAMRNPWMTLGVRAG